MKVLRLIFCLSSLLLLDTARAQDSLDLNMLVSKNQKLIEEYPTEKIYLHFDKPYYAVGDTIWYKVYLANGQNAPSDLSKIAYVELVNERDSVMSSARLQVVNTSAYGQITLDHLRYKSGNYRVRAYTYWMLNYDAAYFFTKTIQIGNALSRQLVTNARFNGIESGNSARVNAEISFSSKEGKPLPNSRVDWKVVSNFETIARGRGTTNAEGKLNVEMTAPQRAALESGVLETVIDADGKQLTSQFPLRNSFANGDVQFFPEGGELVAGIRNKVAFKVLNEQGRGISAKGQVSDGSGQVITSFETQNKGMGVFVLAPEAGKSYKATVTLANGLTKTVDLPQVAAAGISLSAINTDTAALTVRISANEPYLQANLGRGHYIVARSNGVICYAARANLTAAVFSASIPKDKFPTGIVQLTLFSNSGEPLSERLVFIKRPDRMTLAVSSDKKSYGSRQPVKMTVNAKTANQPVQGNYSVSVISETQVPVNEDQETTILSSFLLSSELAGYIEDPNYYFNKINEKKIADLDLLMMTHGYRKFKYEDILANKQPVINFAPEQGIEYSGTLRTANGMPVNRGSLRLVVPGNRYYAETTTDVNGVFTFKNVMATDSAEVSITARNSTNTRNMMIMLDGDAYPSIARNINAPDEVMNLDSLLAPYLQNSQRQYRLAAQMLEEVVVTSAPVKKVNHMNYPALSGLSPIPDHLISRDRFNACNVLLNCLQSVAAGLTFADNNFYVTRVYNSGLRVPVAVFFDGMQVEATYLQTINPADVEDVEVFLTDELGLVNRTYGTNGVLAINSRRTPDGKPVTAADLKKLFPPNNVLTFTAQGYQKSREFYSPKYTTAESRTAGADLRTTIYWNPKVFTEANGNYSFEFYTGDNKGTYRAVVEGTDIDGNLGRTVYRFKVE